MDLKKEGRRVRSLFGTRRKSDMKLLASEQVVGAGKSGAVMCMERLESESTSVEGDLYKSPYVVKEDSMV